MKLKEALSIRFLHVLIVTALVALSYHSISAASTEKTTITFAVWGESPGTWQAVADAFNAQSDYVRLEIFPTGVWWPDITEWLILRMVAGDPPDIAYISPINFRDVYEKGLVIDMLPFMQRDPLYDPEVFWPPVIDWIERDGHVYGFPSGMQSLLTYYNKDLFARAGLPELGDHFSPDEGLEIARKLTRLDPDGGLEQAGMAIIWDLESVFPRVWTNGGDMFDLVGNEYKARFNDEIWHDTLETLRQYHLDYNVSPVSGDMNSWFATRRMGMFYSGTWQMQHFIRALENDLGVAPLPTGSHGYVTPLWPDSYVIPQGASNPQVSWEVIRWMATEGSAILLPSGVAGISTDRKTTIDYLPSAFDDPRIVEVYLKNANQGRIPDYPPHYHDMLREINPWLFSIRDNESAVGVALEQIQAIAERYLARTE